VKTITIRLPDVEAAKLLEVQKRNKIFRNPDGWFGRIARDSSGWWVTDRIHEISVFCLAFFC